MRCELDDPANLTPDQRLQELATILAVGTRRFRRRVAVGPDCGPASPGTEDAPLAPGADGALVAPAMEPVRPAPQSPPAGAGQIETDFSENGLELSAGSRPDGQCG